MLAFIGIIGFFLFLIQAVIGLFAFVFWLWMLIHAITNKGLGDGEKIAWVIVILVLPFLGALIYFFIGKPKGRSALG